jgi:hypothetical protein
MGVLSWLFGRSQQPPRSVSQAEIPGPGSFAVEVVGESHYQDALARICGGVSEDGAEVYKTAVLVLEDENPHDGQAVRVEIDELLVGHLSRKNAREYRGMLAANGHPTITASCRAVIRGGWDRGDGDRGMFGVRLDLPTE